MDILKDILLALVKEIIIKIIDFTFDNLPSKKSKGKTTRKRSTKATGGSSKR